MTKEQKDILKPLSIKYLNKLVQKSQKRTREEVPEQGANKKRRVSDKVLEMRRMDDITDEGVEKGGKRRNNLVSMDRISERSSQVNIFKPNPPKEVNSSQVKVDSWLSKDGKADPAKVTKSLVTTPDKTRVPEKAVFDLGCSPNLSDDVEILPSPPKPVPVVVDISDDEASPPPPVYNRKRLLDFTQLELIKAGILVQVLVLLRLPRLLLLFLLLLLLLFLLLLLLI